MSVSQSCSLAAARTTSCQSAALSLPAARAKTMRSSRHSPRNHGWSGSAGVLMARRSSVSGESSARRPTSMAGRGLPGTEGRVAYTAKRPGAPRITSVRSSARSCSPSSGTRERYAGSCPSRTATKRSTRRGAPQSERVAARCALSVGARRRTWSSRVDVSTRASKAMLSENSTSVQLSRNTDSMPPAPLRDRA